MPPYLDLAQQNQFKAVLQERQYLFTLQQKRIRILQQSRETIQNTLAFYEQWKRELQHKYQLQQQATRQQALNSLAARLEQEQNKWLQLLSQWNESLAKAEETGIKSATHNDLEFNIFEAEEKNNLLGNELNTVKISNKLQDLSFLFNQKLSLSTLSNLQHQIESLSEQVELSKQLLQKKANFLKTYIELIRKQVKNTKVSLQASSGKLARLNTIAVGYQKLLDKIKELAQQLDLQKKLISQMVNVGKNDRSDSGINLGENNRALWAGDK
ncbi:hypothetical protein [Rickettsiella massiliensis]|uniref:hypothetical protein n=1 Tax=Rickettsiella massiliensis TaxID=676517 RepID=UPI00029B0C9C|nr:hypothetical protein [Rickettsiella massiliensis]